MIEPKFDQYGNPDNDTLDAIASWDHEDWSGLLDFLTEAWNYTYGDIKQHDEKICFVTGGCSANEQLVSELQRNMLIDAMYWLSSHRGGEHWYSRGA